MAEHERDDSDFIFFMGIYEKHCLAEGQSVRTVKTKRCNIGMFVNWCFANNIMNVGEVTKNIVEQYKADLAGMVNPRTNELLRKNTKRRRITDVKTFFKELTYLEHFEVNPLENLRLPKVQKTVPTAFLTFEDIELIFDQTVPYGAFGERDRAILETFYSTGARRMEVANLKLTDIDFKKKQIFVTGKGDKERYIPIANRACDWIKHYTANVRPNLVNLKSGLTLFLDNQGMKFRETQMSDLAKKYILKAGFDVNAACNVFRHSAATHMLENGADIREIQQYLGHADLSTTQVYTHVTNVQLKKTYQKSHPAAKSSKKSIASQLSRYNKGGKSYETAL
ncbi:MAG: tyrosine-type recombinase/integrase [Gammaproteobacteria bacterium]|nr:tyrosine-type recombinase/integrase [Gammaproteobacteria bacterium]MCP4061447.1 tyrosine-type recombinase/integrase [Pseudoalteromonas sp.]